MASNSVRGALLSPQATQIETFSGKYVDVSDPDPATVCLQDIAHGLSLICRYNGHVRHFYSVAEHCCLVHDLIPHAIAGQMQGKTTINVLSRAALLHDAAEAYLGDVTAPLKYALRDEVPVSRYDLLSNVMDQAICDHYAYDSAWLDDGVLQLADMWALRIEAQELTHSGGSTWRWEGELPLGGNLPIDVQWHCGLSPEAAKYEYVSRFATAFGTRS